MRFDILYAAEHDAEHASPSELQRRIASLRALRPHLNDQDHEHAGRLIQRLCRLLEEQTEAA